MAKGTKKGTPVVVRQPALPAAPAPRISIETLPLTVQFLGGIGLFSDAIEYCSIGPLSHVDAEASDGWLTGARADSIKFDGKTWPSGLLRRPPGYFGTVRSIVRMTLQVSPQQHAAYWGWLNRHANDKYNWVALLGMFVDRNWSARGHLFCSQAQGIAGEASPLYSRLFLPANRLTPVELALLWSGLGAAVETVKV